MNASCKILFFNPSSTSGSRLSLVKPHFHPALQRGMWLAMVALTLFALPLAAQSRDNIFTRVSALEAALAKLTQQVDSQRQALNTLEAEKSTQAQLISQLQTQIASLQAADNANQQGHSLLQAALADEATVRESADLSAASAARAYADAQTAAVLIQAKVHADKALGEEAILRQLGDQAAETYADDGIAEEKAERIAGDTAARAYTDTQTAAEKTARQNADAAERAYVDAKVNPINTSVNSLSDKLFHFRRSGNEVYITGANLNVRNGAGNTYQGVNGLGNLVLGYNELRDSGNDRSGSHNLVLGSGHNYTRAGAILTGINNNSLNHFASVLGGTGNTASGVYSVVVGGYNNTASGGWSTILGGRDVTASGQLDHKP